MGEQIATTTATKICCRCKKTKQSLAFAFRPGVCAPRLQPWCIECKREYDRVTIAQKRATAPQRQDRT